MRITALLLALSLTAAGTDAQEREKSGFRAQALERFDADEDGELSRGELNEAKKAWIERVGEGSRRKARQLWVERFDRNGDGSLDTNERETLQRQRRAALQRFDQNGDGRLGPREKRAAKDERRTSFPQRAEQRSKSAQARARKRSKQ